MRSLCLIVALAAGTSPAVAQTAAKVETTAGAVVAAKRGATLFDNGATRIGTVLAVRNNGSVLINFRSAQVTVPAATLSMVNGKLTTSLSKAEVAKLD